jgi:hypothetical protein
MGSQSRGQPKGGNSRGAIGAKALAFFCSFYLIRITVAFGAEAGLFHAVQVVRIRYFYALTPVARLADFLNTYSIVLNRRPDGGKSVRACCRI